MGAFVTFPPLQNKTFIGTCIKIVAIHHHPILDATCLKPRNRQTVKRSKALVTAASFATRSAMICLLLRSNQLRPAATARFVRNQPSHRSGSPAKMTLNSYRRPRSKRFQTTNGSRRTSTGTFAQSAAFKFTLAASTNCQVERRKPSSPSML